MFNLFKKKEVPGTEVTLRIEGMHCSSCAMSIDGLLEETEGVISCSASYAQAKVTIKFDPAKTSKERIIEVLSKMEYHFFEETSVNSHETEPR